MNPNDVGEQNLADLENHYAVVKSVTNIFISLCSTSANLTQKLINESDEFVHVVCLILKRSTDEVVILTVLCLVKVLLNVVYETGGHRTTQSNHGNDAELSNKNDHNIGNDNIRKDDIEIVYVNDDSNVQTKNDECGMSSTTDVTNSELDQSKLTDNLFSSSSSSTLVEENSSKPVLDSNVIEQSGNQGHLSWDNVVNHGRLIDAIRRQDLGKFGCFFIIHRYVTRNFDVFCLVYLEIGFVFFWMFIVLKTFSSQTFRSIIFIPRLFC